MADWLPPGLAVWFRTFTFLDGILWILAGIGVLLFIKRGWPWLKDFAAALMKFVQIVDSVKDLPEFIKRTDDSIASIYHETHKNDGSSIKDAGDRTEKLVNEIFDTLAVLVTSDEKQWTAIEEGTRPPHPKETP